MSTIADISGPAELVAALSEILDGWDGAHVCIHVYTHFYTHVYTHACAHVY